MAPADDTITYVTCAADGTFQANIPAPYNITYKRLRSGTYYIDAVNTNEFNTVVPVGGLSLTTDTETRTSSVWICPRFKGSLRFGGDATLTRSAFILNPILTTS